MVHIVACTREQALACLPKKMDTLEVGVQSGAFSRHIVDTARPALHCMVDSYRHFGDGSYGEDVANVGDAGHEALYRNVLRSFAPEIARGAARVFRRTYAEFDRDADDATFDFIYIDAMHTYDAVLEDLFRSAGRLRKDGILAGHDYCQHASARKQGFGVVRAVTEFRARTGFSLLCLTAEPWASYFLASGQSKMGAFFLKRLLARFASVPVEDALAEKIALIQNRNGEINVTLSEE